MRKNPRFVMSLILFAAMISCTIVRAASSQDLLEQIEELQDQLAAVQQQQDALKVQIQNKQKSKQAAVDVSAEKGLLVVADSTEGRKQAPQPDPAFVQIPYGHKLLANLGGTAVISSPYIHNRFEYKASGLLANYSSINRDVAALKQRRAFESAMLEAGLDLPPFPLLELSGNIEGQVFAVRRFNGAHFEDIELSNVELDLQALINPWILGFMSFDYDNSPPAVGRRLANSNIFVDSAFITIGNLIKTPWYATLGQLYVPFGQYNSYMITNSLGKTLFRTKGREIAVGYERQGAPGPYAAVTVFRGDSQEGISNSRYINQYGVNLGYDFKFQELHADLGMSFINNVTDSNGMQNTGAGAPRFGGFGSPLASQDLVHRVHGVDVRAIFDYGPMTFISEYTTATTAFDPSDVSFNGSGAKPAALHLEGVYHFKVYQRPVSISLAAEQAYEALAFSVPKRRYSAGLGTSIWRNTLLSLQVAHDQNWGANDMASGSGGAPFGRVGGSSRTSYFSQFDIYF